MIKKFRLLLLLLIVLISLSGCLVSDDSTTLVNEETKVEITAEATEITNEFFKYNEYNQEEKPYDPEKLIELFKEQEGTVLTINSILGTDVGQKNLAILKEELRKQKTIFEKQDPYGYKLFFEYQLFFDDDKITDYTAPYYAKFKVFEQVDEMSRAELTDNGYVHFELIKEHYGWVINYMIIDLQRLGTVDW